MQNKIILVLPTKPFCFLAFLLIFFAIVVLFLAPHSHSPSPPPQPPPLITHLVDCSLTVTTPPLPLSLSLSSLSPFPPSLSPPPLSLPLPFSPPLFLSLLPFLSLSFSPPSSVSISPVSLSLSDGVGDVTRMSSSYSLFRQRAATLAAAASPSLTSLSLPCSLPHSLTRPLTHSPTAMLSAASFSFPSFISELNRQQANWLTG